MQMAAFSDAEQRAGFAVRWSAAKGRHLVAARDFDPGTLVLQQEPYAATLLDEHTPSRCDHCFGACERPLRCSRSKFARYCCKEHQRDAWLAGFKTECEALVRCAPRVPPPTVRLAARILWRRARALEQQQRRAPGPGEPLAPQQQPQQPQQGPPPQQPQEPQHVHHAAPHDADRESVWLLQHHWAALDDGRKALYGQMAVVTWQYMYGTPDAPGPAEEEDAPSAHPLQQQQQQQQASPSAQPQQQPAGGLPEPGTAPPAPAAAWPGFRAVAQLLARLACNCHSVCDEELRPIAIGLYSTAALVNHSCRPSAVQVFAGRTLQLRAAVPLRAGDEVTIAYVELAATRQERREQLAATYFFDTCGTPQLQPPQPSAGVQQPPQPPAAAPTGDGAAAPAAVTTATDMEVDVCSSAARSATSSSEAGGGRATGADGAQQAAAAPPPAAAPLAVRPAPLLTLEVERGALLHVFPPHDERPPWPTDDCDAALTRVVLAAPSGSGAATASGRACPRGGGNAVVGGGGAVPLPGGLLARLIPRPAHEPEEEEEEEEEREEEEDDDNELGRADAAMDEGAGECGSAERKGAGPDASARDAWEELGCGGAGADGAEVTAEATRAPTDLHGAGPGSRRPPLRLQLGDVGRRGGPGVPRPPRMELLAWGPWAADLLRAAAAVRGRAVEDAPAAASGGARAGAGAEAANVAMPSAAEAAALLRRCVRAMQLCHEAQVAAGDKQHAEAVALLEGALRLVEPPQQEQQQQQQEQPGPHRRPPHRPPPQPSAPTPRTLSLGPHHLLPMRIRAQLLKAAVDAGAAGPGGGVGEGHCEGGVWDVALRAARRLCAPYRLVYPGPAHPALSLHLATTAKLEALRGRPRRALRAAAGALAGLRLTHAHAHARGGGGCGVGGDGGVLAQVVQVAREAEAELRMRGGPAGAEEEEEEEQQEGDEQDGAEGAAL